METNMTRVGKTRVPNVRVFQDRKELARLSSRAAPWAIQWRVDGRKHQETIGTKREADDAAKEKQQELFESMQNGKAKDIGKIQTTRGR